MSGKFFEIREFIDDNGRPINNEIVDLSQQIDELEMTIESQRKQKKKLNKVSDSDSDEEEDQTYLKAKSLIGQLKQNFQFETEGYEETDVNTYLN